MDKWLKTFHLNLIDTVVTTLLGTFILKVKGQAHRGRKLACVKMCIVPSSFVSCVYWLKQQHM